MAPRYDISADFGPPDVQSTSPHWVVGFARYANPVTYDPNRRAAVSGDLSFAYAERDPLVVADCTSVTVSSSKDSHRMTAALELADTGVKYLREVLPGDWVVVNVVYDADAARSVADRMRGRSGRVNRWEDGLKFVGRVKAVTKSVVVAPNGTPTSTYAVACEGFSEFDTVLMYYPQLQQSDSIPVQMQKWGVEVGKIVRGGHSNDRGAVDMNLIIPKMMRVIFGQGAWTGQRFRDDALAPNQSYIVPDTIFKWLGVRDESNEVGSIVTGGTYADLVRILLGVQQYRTSANATGATAPPGELFWPDGVSLSDGAFRCPDALLGSFPIDVVPQTSISAWAFMSNYMNAPINEPLTVLRADQFGYVYPFFVLRQTPYTSNRQVFVVGTEATERFAVAKFPVTRFLDLPRWVAPPSVLQSASLSRVDSMRYNLVYVFGSGPGLPFDPIIQFINGKPVFDQLDVARNGLRPYMPSVNAFTRVAQAFPADFRDLMADVVMDQYLTLSGQVVLAGVRAPIAPGDNLEVEGIVYHIEGVSHSASVAPNGVRNFTTTLSVSRGVLDVELPESREAMFSVNPADPEGATVAVNEGG